MLKDQPTHAYKAKMNLPFNIKKGDIIYSYNNNVSFYDISGNNILMEVNKEPSFFDKEEVPQIIHKVDQQMLITKHGNYATEANQYAKIPISAWTVGKVIGFVKPNRTTFAKVAVGSNIILVKQDDLIEYKPYWFINTSGEVHEAMEGRNTKADTFRKKAGNYYKVKADADKVLYEIESVIV